MEKNFTTTFGKIILIGEHSVVYGKPAIAIPFTGAKLLAHIEKTNSKRDLIEFNYEKLLINQDDENIFGLCKLVEEIKKEYNIKENIKIKISSTIPIQRGIGASASAAIAITKSIFKYYNIDFTKEDIIRFASISEDITHGNSSGIDINVIAFNKAIYYIKNEKMENFNIDLDAYLIIADTGEKGKTSEAVDRVRKSVENDRKKQNLIEELGVLVEDAKKHILNKEIKELGKDMNLSHEKLSLLGVSNDSLDKLVNIARNSGALGAKLTGGGLGGCMIALAEDYPTMEKIKKNLLEVVDKVWYMKLKEESNEKN